MIDITNEMSVLINNAMDDRLPCLLGTASRDGQPQISPKGSVLVYDHEALAYWERAGRSAQENVAENPRVVIFYRNPAKHINWRFYGVARIYPEGPVREDVMSRVIPGELERDPERIGVAVLVRVDRITDLAGNVLQQREEG